MGALPGFGCSSVLKCGSGKKVPGGENHISKGLEGRLDDLKLLPAVSVRGSGDQTEKEPAADLGEIPTIAK